MGSRPSLEGVGEHMLQLGLAALAHANWHAAFISPENDYWSELSVIQAAHAAEIIIKARIATEHPLLIFEQLPKQSGASANELSMSHLLESGRTYQFSDLPDRLWATTGISLEKTDVFRSFGKLRNQIQHFTHPDENDLSQRTLAFVFGVIDPFINRCWGLHAVDFCEDYAGHEYFVPTLIRSGIPFLVSPTLAEGWDQIEKEWPDNSSDFKTAIEAQVSLAKASAQ